MALFEKGKPKLGTPRTATPKSQRLPSAFEKKKAKEACAVAPALADMVIGFFFPNSWTAEDRITPEECEILGEGIYAEVEQHAKAVIFISAIATPASAHSKFLRACIILSLPRLARRNIISQDMAAKMMFAAMMMSAEDGPNSFSVEGGSAHGDIGPDGRGQEHHSGVATGQDDQVLRGHAYQARKAGAQDRVPGSDSDNGERARQGESGSQLGEDQSWLDEPSPGSVGGETEVLRKVRNAA